MGASPRTSKVRTANRSFHRKMPEKRHFSAGFESQQSCGMEVRMKRAVVTGATSFIGVHLVNRLILEGWKVYAVARKGSRRVALLPLNEQIEIVYLDMEEYSKLGESIKRGLRCFCFLGMGWNEGNRPVRFGETETKL